MKANAKQKMWRTLFCLLASLLLWMGLVFVGSQLFARWIGPIGDQLEYDKPTDPEALYRHFADLKQLWERCTPLGYTSINLDADVSVGEAQCAVFSSSRDLLDLLRDDLLHRNPTLLWIQEGDNWLSVAWPCSIFAKSCEPSEISFIFRESRLIVVSGELVCSKGTIVNRERCYREKLKNYLGTLPSLPRGVSCYEATNSVSTSWQKVPK